MSRDTNGNMKRLVYNTDTDSEVEHLERWPFVTEKQLYLKLISKQQGAEVNKWEVDKYKYMYLHEFYNYMYMYQVTLIS